MEILSTFPECTIAISTRDDGHIESATSIELLLEKQAVRSVKEIVLPDHEHGTTCIDITASMVPSRLSCDGLLTKETGVALSHRYGDCVPIIFLDRKRRVLATAHGGWKGLTLGIVAEALLRLQSSYRSEVNDVWVWIGPCIQKQSYVSSEPPMQLVFGKWKECVSEEKDGFHVDLPLFVTKECARLGIDESHIISDGRDTYENRDIFFSFARSKREKDAESNGRFMISTWLT
jgi:polyphenol oxidase